MIKFWAYEQKPEETKTVNAHVYNMREATNENNSDKSSTIIKLSNNENKAKHNSNNQHELVEKKKYVKTFELTLIKVTHPAHHRVQVLIQLMINSTKLQNQTLVQQQPIDSMEVCPKMAVIQAHKTVLK